MSLTEKEDKLIRLKTRKLTLESMILSDQEHLKECIDEIEQLTKEIENG